MLVSFKDKKISEGVEEDFLKSREDNKMASIPIETITPTENVPANGDSAKSGTAEDFDAQFLRDWGFTLRDTYRLTLRFYKGKVLKL